MTNLTASALDVPAPATSVEVRLAAGPHEVRAAQRLRYRVFYDEMGARPDADALASGLDVDRFDSVCDHLLAIVGGEVVGTYRLIRRQAAAAAGGFYSADEFDINRLVRQPGEILELGRSCVAARWRSRGVLQALWRGLSDYISDHDVGLLFGCASLPASDIATVAPQIAYLQNNHAAPPDLRARALPDRRVADLPTEVVGDPRRVLLSLPPLLKGYLRAGATVGEGAVLDAQFNTIDVLVVLPTEDVASRYQRHYDQVSL